MAFLIDEFNFYFHPSYDLGLSTYFFLMFNLFNFGVKTATFRFE